MRRPAACRGGGSARPLRDDVFSMLLGIPARTQLARPIAWDDDRLADLRPRAGTSAWPAGKRVAPLPMHPHAFFLPPMGLLELGDVMADIVDQVHAIPATIGQLGANTSALLHPWLPVAPGEVGGPAWRRRCSFRAVYRGKAAGDQDAVLCGALRRWSVVADLIPQAARPRLDIRTPCLFPGRRRPRPPRRRRDPLYLQEVLPEPKVPPPPRGWGVVGDAGWVEQPSGPRPVGRGRRARPRPSSGPSPAGRPVPCCAEQAGAAGRWSARCRNSASTSSSRHDFAIEQIGSHKARRS